MKLQAVLLTAVMATACGPDTATTSTDVPIQPDPTVPPGIVGNVAQTCQLSSDCPPAESCVDGECALACREDRDCPTNTKCGADQHGVAMCVAATTPDTPPYDPSGDCPDEVGCLLADVPPPCCDKYKKGGGGSTGGSVSGGTIPDDLSRDEISAGMSRIRSDVVKCGETHAGAGTVKIKVTVAPSGAVTQVDVVSSPTVDLGACIAALARNAFFSASVNGRTFTYPFVFR